jgi:transcription elongation factor GreA
MIEDVRRRLADEVERLNYELNVTLPDALNRALANGDLRENGDYHAALERQGFVQARLSHLRSRLARISQIDPTQIPVDRVGLGSRVDVVDRASKTKETFELVIPDAMDVERGHISVASPLGRALIDQKVGATVEVRLPSGVRKLTIKKLATMHERASDEAS